VFRSIDRGMKWSHDHYGSGLRRVFRRRGIVIGVFVLALLATVFLYRATPSGFVPEEDQGYIIIAEQGPAGASLQSTVAVTTQVEQLLAQQPEVERVFNVNGFSFAGPGSNRAIMFAALKPF